VDGTRGAMAPGVLAYGAAVLMIAAATGAGLLIAPRWGMAPVVLLYLPAVLAAAIYCGLWPSLIAAAASALAYNYFFTAPYRTFLIHNPADGVTVAMLFVWMFEAMMNAPEFCVEYRLPSSIASLIATFGGMSSQWSSS